MEQQTVWCLIGQLDWEQDGLLGVYSSRQLAEDALKEYLTALNDDKWDFDRYVTVQKQMNGSAQSFYKGLQICEQ